MARKIQFYLNDHLVVFEEPEGLLVLDYLRKKAHLTGTKEGCKEGDCGACTVLLGELKDNGIHYSPVTSCLVPMGELHGRHLVTVEGVTMPQLSPVQKAMVDEGGSQCGYCTPGFIMSMTWFWMEEKNFNMDHFKRAISGNLCRCTGYGSIKRAGESLLRSCQPGEKWDFLPQASHRMKSLVEHKMLPPYFLEMAEKLKAIPPLEGPAIEESDHFVAGGTDIYVQKGEDLPDSRITALNLFPEMKKMVREGDFMRVGGLTTFEEFANHEEIQKIFPQIQKYMSLIASLPIRNRATLAGNIVNASPIGDMTIFLLSLNSEVVLKEKETTRTVPMKEFFKGYKNLEKRPKEILTEIRFPIPSGESRVNFEKVSKRKYLDIASVNSAILVSADSKGTVLSIEMTAGGVAPIPFFLKESCAFLKGKKIEALTIQSAIEKARGEISPISDVRGSKEYKSLLLGQLIIAHFTTLYPEFVKVQDFYTTV